MTRMVLIRHGQSVWNAANRFTGWTDVELSLIGKAEAAAAGEQLADIRFDVDRKSTRLNSSHVVISYAVFCLKKKINQFNDSLVFLRLEPAFFGCPGTPQMYSL